MVKGCTQLRCVVTLSEMPHNHDSISRAELDFLAGNLTIKGGTQLLCVATLIGSKHDSRTEHHLFLILHFLSRQPDDQGWHTAALCSHLVRKGALV